jgi:hypothetical protein
MISTTLLTSLGLQLISTEAKVVVIFQQEDSCSLPISTIISTTEQMRQSKCFEPVWLLFKLLLVHSLKGVEPETTSNLFYLAVPAPLQEWVTTPTSTEISVLFSVEEAVLVEAPILSSLGELQSLASLVEVDLPNKTDTPPRLEDCLLC